MGYEPYLKFQFWEWLEKNPQMFGAKHLRIFSEVSLGSSGTMDIVAEENGIYYGFELKERPDLVGNEEIEKTKKLDAKQAKKYADSQQLNYVYLVTNDYDQVDNSINDAIGHINYKGNVGYRIKTEGKPLTRSGTPSLRYNESNLSHTLIKWYFSKGYSFFNYRKGKSILLEARLPNPNTDARRLLSNNELDDAIFKALMGKSDYSYKIVDVILASHDSFQVFNNQKNTEYYFTGIELKNNLSNPNQIANQLKNYIESGGLTDLYLCVPAEYETQAMNLLKNFNLDEVGLLIIKTAVATTLTLEPDVRVAKFSKRLIMKYHSMAIFEIGKSVPSTSMKGLELDIGDSFARTIVPSKITPSHFLTFRRARDITMRSYENYDTIKNKILNWMFYFNEIVKTH